MKPTYEELEQRVRELERARIECKDETASLRQEEFFSLLVDYSLDILAFIDRGRGSKVCEPICRKDHRLHR